jgi:hypothetical protein
MKKKWLVVGVKVDKELKDELEAYCEQMGSSPSAIGRILFKALLRARSEEKQGGPKIVHPLDVLTEPTAAVSDHTESEKGQTAPKEQDSKKRKELSSLLNPAA